MNIVTRWFLTGALLAALGTYAASASAAQDVTRTQNSGTNATLTVAGASHHGTTEVQIGSTGINVSSGSDHVRIGNSSVGIVSGTQSITVHSSHHSCPSGRELVAIGHDIRLAADKSACDVVSIFGDNLVAGDVSDSAVAILGDLRVTGSVGNSTVSIFGDSDINGTVAGNAVSLFGNLQLGPKAVIQGQSVNLFGSVHRDPGATIQGGTVNLMSGIFHGARGLRTWSEHCLLLGRLLAPRLDISWAWGVALGVLLFYALLALLFRDGVQRCMQTLEDHPGASILAALAMTLLTPVLMLALVVTIVGIFAIPLFWLALFGVAIFGRVVALGWLGGRILRGMHRGVTQPVLHVLLGGVLALALYMVPVLGFIVYTLIGLVGFGAVIYSLLLAMRAARDTSTPDNATVGLGTPAAVLGVEPAGATSTGASEQSAAEPMDYTTLPRAGFWIRMAALLIDVVLVTFALSMVGHNGANGSLLVLAVYGALMWKLRGTTVGGIICHLRVVRIDGQPVNWETAILRALGCFLSLVVAGLGFIWIAFDRERQAWHDKIAGTVVVVAPKVRGLI